MVTDVVLYKDDVNDMHRQIFDYAATLTFWRALEERYRDRKRKWLALRAAPKVTVPLNRECAILKTTVTLDNHLGTPEESYSTVTDEFLDAVTDKEFSDVDSDLFTDPGDVRHSTLDAEAWARICAEIRALHRRTQNKLEKKRRLYLCKLVFATAFAILLLLGAALLFWKVFLTAPSENTQDCTIRCYGGAETVVSEIIDTMFPNSNQKIKV